MSLEFKLDNLIFNSPNPKRKRDEITETLQTNLKMQGFRVFLGPFAIRYVRNDIGEVLKRKGQIYVESSKIEYLAYIENIRLQAESMSKNYQDQKN